MACRVEILNGTIPQVEIDAYIAHAKKKYGREPVGMKVRLDGDYVDLDYDFGCIPFERIRRITGYLVGTLDRFNNGKRAEERERVKHGM